MDTYAFTISVGERYSDELADRLFVAGCDDALIHEEDGHLRLDFDRDADSYAAAVESAQADVRRAGATATGVQPLEALAPLP